MATVKGIWVFNETLTTAPSYFVYPFVSNGLSCTAMGEAASDGYSVLYYHGPDVFAYYFKTSTWANDAYRTVDFGEDEQTVSDAFYTWLTSNAVSQTIEEPSTPSTPSAPSADALYGVYASELTAVADAIRGKTGKADSLTLEQMVTEIESISGGVTGELPPIAEEEYFGGTSIEEKYLIQGETLENIAVAIQNKKETTAFFTPEQMAVEIETIVTGDNLPLAEDASFGTAEDEVEYGITSSKFGNQVGSTHKLGWEFMPKEDFAVLGFRWAGNAFVSNGYAATLELWDAEKQTQIATLRVTDGEHNVWKEYRFEDPINLLAGKAYAVTMQSGGFANMSNIVFNPKLTYIRAINANNGYPASTTSGYFPVDIIIGKAITGSVVDEYKIHLDTLTELADEVKRITGATGTISPAQMLNLLKDVSTQTEA